jgi:hypothetical protein
LITGVRLLTKWIGVIIAASAVAGASMPALAQSNGDVWVQPGPYYPQARPMEPAPPPGSPGRYWAPEPNPYVYRGGEGLGRFQIDYPPAPPPRQDGRRAPEPAVDCPAAPGERVLSCRYVPFDGAR